MFASNNEKNANRFRYHAGDVVDDYMKEKHHALRLKKAHEMITDCLDASFHDFAHEEISILEIAGATGHMSSVLSREGYSVLLTDSESLPLEKAVQREPSLQIKVMDASKEFPFEDNSFHAIYAGEIIEHLFD